MCRIEKGSVKKNTVSGVEPGRGRVSSCAIAGVTGGDVFRRDGEGLLGRP